MYFTINISYYRFIHSNTVTWANLIWSSKNEQRLSTVHDQHNKYEWCNCDVMGHVTVAIKLPTLVIYTHLVHLLNGDHFVGHGNQTS